MPRKEINNYVFYKIICISDDIDLCYVGSTANWKARNHKHKSNCNNENSNNYNHKIYKTIRENGGWTNFKMVQIETREQLTKRQAEQIEEQYRVELKANMNGKRCFITEQQKQEQIKKSNKKYCDNNKDKINEQKHNYYQENRDKILEYQQNYREENMDKIKEQKQNYHQENKDKINEKASKYYKENKDKINEKALEKVKCDCGCMCSKINLLRHQKTKKHIKLMNQIKPENKN